MFSENLEKVLGFDQIREILADFAATEAGKEDIYDLEFTSDILIIKSDLDLVDEMKRVLTSGTFPISASEDILPFLTEILSGDQYIDPEQLYELGVCLRVINKICKFGEVHKRDYQDITEIINEMCPQSELERVISKTVNSEGEILDTASSALKSIRNQITIQRNRIRSKVQDSFSAYKHAGYSRDEEVTIRNGRLVIPIKAENRSKIQGVVHDESASGNTVYVEPLEAIEANVKLSRLINDEREEINRILRSISGLIYAVKAQIVDSFELLTELDIIYAKARFAIKFDCNKVKVNTRNITNIYYGYHPILVNNHGKKAVVPLNLEIGEKFSTLVITGPNAGGKTVTLKTIGLFSLMLKAGMQVPCDSHSNLAIYSNIFADIGDNQSIENDLSTFSSNIRRISRIMGARNRKTLVLLDEIGASTDPAEGSALSMAILEEFTKRRYTSVATTHQGVLKSFAYKTKGIENGSMEFDRERIEPTYKFRPAIPGSSYAFEISKRHGLPTEIIKKASEYLGSEKENLEKLISDLDEKLTKYNQLVRSSENTNEKLKDLKEHYDKKFTELKKKEKKILKEAAMRGDAIIANANRLIENAVAEIRRVSADKTKVKQIRQNLVIEKDKILDKHLKYNDKESAKKKFSGELEVGIEVRPDGFSSWGTITEVKSKGKEVVVAMGSMDLTVKKKKIIDARKPVKDNDVEVNFDYSTPDDFVGIRLDLRGMRGDAALAKLDKHLDNMKLQNISICEIVHGKGDGILDKLVNKYLEKHPLVKSRQYGKPGEGDYGVTIVEIC